MSSIIKNQQTINVRSKYAAALVKVLQYEKKGDELFKLGRQELAYREYNKGLKLEEQLFGKSHPVVQELQHKLKSEQTGWKKAAQRVKMVALSQSIKHEKHGDYLFKNEKVSLAAREYEQCLNIEQRILGKDHPLVVALAQKYAATQPLTPAKTLTAVNTLTNVETMSASSSVPTEDKPNAQIKSLVLKKADPIRHDVPKPLVCFEQRIVTPMAA